MKPKARKFHIRRTSAPAAGAGGGLGDGPGGGPFGPAPEDGFGDKPFPGSAQAEKLAANDAGIAEIRGEGLTGRQLRMARRLAQKHGMEPASDFDAVRLLRARGIDPFDRANMLELVVPKPERSRSAPAPIAAAPAAPAGLRAGLPQPVPEPQKNLPGPPASDDALRLHELERIQRDIARRRRFKLGFLAARLLAFVILPTIAAAWYFAFIATPSYATKSEFVVQHADNPSVPAGLLGNTSLATSQDSIMVQDFLGSREALNRLDADYGYRQHFSQPSVDALQRLPAGASNEEVYGHFKKHVKIGYDPTEGIIRMEVSALSPQMSQTFSQALIRYAEERVDKVTERKRADQMRDARASFDEAESKMMAAQNKVLDLQEQLGVLDPATETAALMQQVTTFDTQLSQKKLQLQQLLDNARPNQARVAGVEGDIARLEDLIAGLRSQMTKKDANKGSLASVSAKLSMAKADLETRTALMQEALKQMEAARLEANRQVRFLSVGVAPVPPDEPTYPHVFDNTLIAFLIFAGLYLLASITASVLREQVSS